MGNLKMKRVRNHSGYQALIEEADSCSKSSDRAQQLFFNTASQLDIENSFYFGKPSFMTNWYVKTSTFLKL
jgi:hypothetical protein